MINKKSLIITGYIIASVIGILLGINYFGIGREAAGVCVAAAVFAIVYFCVEIVRLTRRPDEN